MIFFVKLNNKEKTKKNKIKNKIRIKKTISGRKLKVNKIIIIDKFKGTIILKIFLFIFWYFKKIKYQKIVFKKNKFAAKIFQ